MTHGSVQKCATGIFIYLIAISFIDQKMIRSSFFFWLVQTDRKEQHLDFSFQWKFLLSERILWIKIGEF